MKRTDKALVMSVRISPAEKERLDKGAELLGIERAAYLRLLLRRGMESLLVEHTANQVKRLDDKMDEVLDALKPAPRTAAAELPLEIRELLFLLLSCSVEIRAIDRNLMIKAFSQKPLDDLQANLGLAMEKWRGRMGLPPAVKS